MNKKVLFITHQLSKTGAPIVLLDMIQFCKNNGCEIVVMSMEEGILRSTLEDMGIPVIIRDRFLPDYQVFLSQVELFDVVVANTLITFEAIQVLKYGKVPVIWWLHEGRQYFEYFAEVIPDFQTLPEHIHVYAVSTYVQNAMRELYQYEAPLLPIGVDDVCDEKNAIEERISTNEKPNTSHRIRFVVSGTYSKIKGQDVLAEAVRKLPSEYMEQIEIEFYGNLEMRDEEVFQSVKALEEQFENIHIMPFVSHDEMLVRMAQADAILIPSRIDPLPTVAVEAMMLCIPCICSDVCGIAKYMEHEKTGILFESEKVKDLSEKIIYALEHRGQMRTIGANSRRIYEEYYSKEVFEANLRRIFE